MDYALYLQKKKQQFFNNPCQKTTGLNQFLSFIK